MLIKILLLFLMWLVIRRFWRLFFGSAPRSSAQRPPYPGPGKDNSRNKPPSDITDQKISEADFEELED